MSDGDGVDAFKRVDTFPSLPLLLSMVFTLKSAVSSVKLFIIFFGLSNSFMNNWEHNLKVVSGSDFRDDAAVFFEDVDLGNDDVTQNGFAVFYDRGGSFIA